MRPSYGDETFRQQLAAGGDLRPAFSCLPTRVRNVLMAAGYETRDQIVAAVRRRDINSRTPGLGRISYGRLLDWVRAGHEADVAAERSEHDRIRRLEFVGLPTLVSGILLSEGYRTRAEVQRALESGALHAPCRRRPRIPNLGKVSFRRLVEWANADNP